MTLDQRQKLDHELCVHAGIDYIKRFVGGSDRGLVYLEYHLSKGYSLTFSREAHPTSSIAAVAAALSGLGLIAVL